ncbi:MAG: protein-export membrane protein SecD [Elusimicrobia bacterium RIFCSPLOWO2_01_FULL_59_12]|nr:MAG: protein-export membrane protein SecD [Elusimicrobia bacterium RIFCSPLOWO2_01_FULL_59_12]
MPTVTWYRLAPDERTEREQDKDPIVSKILNLGLDLRGGTHLVLELDRSKLDPKLSVIDALERAIEIIRNRVDQFGVAEPLIARQGERWIVVQLPGIKDPERAKELIGKTALLEFRLVDDSGALSKLTSALGDKRMSMTQYLDLQQKGQMPKDLARLIPEGYEVLLGRESRYVVVRSSPELTGSTLVDARVELGGQFGYPTVSIEFNPEGTRLFAAVTEANVGKNLAIVLDGSVQSAPVIRSAIPDGHAVIEGTFSSEDAKLLSTVLRAGALPAPVRVIEERTVGPSLGEDSIKAGVRASLIGLGLVILFMIIYYRTSGLIADLAMAINMLFIFGVMASLHATLTLPGIAGTILSLAMAVDANVLILERVREELQLGKTVRLAVDLGYQHAWSAIIDGHVTTLISAGLLFQFGTGPIKGFAVTLFWGVLISIFTAVFFTRMVYDMWLERSEVKSLNF